VRGVVHWWQTRPVVGPTVHVLLMARLQKLNLAQLAFLVQLAQEQKLTGVDDCLGHHVLESSFLHQLDDLSALVHSGGHRHRTHDVFARFQSGNRLAGMIGNGRIDVNEVHVGIGEHVLEAREAFGHAERIADFVKFLVRSLADGVHVGVGVMLINGNKLCPKAQTDDRDVDFLLGHWCLPRLQQIAELVREV